MSESDSTAVRTARMSEPENKSMPGVTDPYLREQLEKRREQLKTNIAVIPADDAESTAPLLDLLQEVDSAVERMDHGTYGVCEACQDTLSQGTAPYRSAGSNVSRLPDRRRAARPRTRS